MVLWQQRLGVQREASIRVYARLPHPVAHHLQPRIVKAAPMLAHVLGNLRGAVVIEPAALILGVNVFSEREGVRLEAIDDILGEARYRGIVPAAPPFGPGEPFYWLICGGIRSPIHIPNRLGLLREAIVQEMEPDLPPLLLLLTKRLFVFYQPDAFRASQPAGSRLRHGAEWSRRGVHVHVRRNRNSLKLARVV